MFANTLPDDQVYLKGWNRLQYIILLSRLICIKFDYRRLFLDQLFFFIIFVTVSEIMLGSESQFSKARLNYFSICFISKMRLVIACVVAGLFPRARVTFEQ